MEHPFDRNRLAAWSHGAVAGVLADDTTPYLGNRVPLNFFTVTLMLDARGQVGAAAGGFVFTTWQSRIMNAMGTTPNRRILSLAASTLNNLKRMVRPDPQSSPLALAPPQNMAQANLMRHPDVAPQRKLH